MVEAAPRPCLLPRESRGAHFVRGWQHRLAMAAAPSSTSMSSQTTAPLAVASSGTVRPRVKPLLGKLRFQRAFCSPLSPMTNGYFMRNRPGLNLGHGYRISCGAQR